MKLEDNFEHILNHWFDKSEELEFIVRQFSKIFMVIYTWKISWLMLLEI